MNSKLFYILLFHLLSFGPAIAQYQSCISNCFQQGIEDVIFNWNVVNSDTSYAYFSLSTNGGCDNFNPGPLTDATITLTPSKPDQLINGISPNDMVRVQEHIDGINPFQSPYQWIAADANNDSVIDTFDIVECRKLMLGIYAELPDNSAWRMVAKSYQFPAPDPLTQPFPESVTFGLNGDPVPDLDFVAVRICDVSCSELVSVIGQVPENLHFIGEAQPNPTTTGAWLPFRLLRQETLTLQLTDMSGRLLLETSKTFPAGTGMLEIPASAMPDSGMYFWKVAAGETVRSGKLIKG
ncbi:MAG: T9SS type A sorting domain-containing protein [Saprospiraceae bacterium]